MKILRNSLLLLAFILFACNVNKKTAVVHNNTDNSIIEQEYYRNFIEGVKQEINGNYKNAIALYNDCINKFPNHAAPYYQLSNIFLKAQNIDKAKEYAVKAEELVKDNIWYKLHLANIYQFQNVLDSAIRLYEDIIKIDQNPEYIYNLALLYSQNNKEEDALNMLDILQKEYNGSKEIFVLKHNLYNNLKLYDSAVFELKELTKNFPEEISNYGMLAEYLSDIGRGDEAKEIYNYALKIDSTNSLVLLSYGDFYLKKELEDSAFIFYSKAFSSNYLDSENKMNILVNFLKNKEFTEKNRENIKILLDKIQGSKDNFLYYAIYADYYSNLQEYEKSVVYMDSALILKRDNYFLWEQSILVSNYLKDYKNVISKVDTCLSYFPDKENLMLIKAYAQHFLEDDEEAIVTAKLIIKKSEIKDLKVQSYNLLGEIYRNQSKFELSDACFEDILKIDPENLMIRNNYSYYLALRQDKLERALELSQYTIMKEPKNSTYLDTYGWILFKVGKYKESKDYIESAIRYGAYNNAEVLDHYGEVMLKLNKCKDAIEAWERINEIDSTYIIMEKLDSIKINCN